MEHKMSKIKALKNLFMIGLTQKNKLRIYAILMIELSATAMAPLLSYLSKLIVDLLAETYRIKSLQLLKESFFTILGIFIITVLMLLLNKSKELLQAYINHDTAKKISGFIFHRLQKIKYEYFEDPETYNVINRVSTNCPQIFSMINTFITLITAILSSISAGLLLGSIRWYFIIIILIPNLFYTLAESKNLLERYFLSLNQTNDNRKLRYMHTLFQDKKSNKEIRAFGLLDILLNKYNDLRIKLYKQGSHLLLKQSIISFLLSILSKLGVFACLFFTCTAFINKTASLGDVALVLSSGSVFAVSINNIFSQINAVTNKTIHINDWMTFEHMEIELDDSEEMDTVETITFSNVSYQYPHADNLALKDVTCKINRGEIIALVGENGSGKSTFIKLLLGALTPNEGTITINKKPLHKLLQCFRKKVAYIPQNHGAFKITLKDNLRLGNNNMNFDEYVPKFINFQEKMSNGFSTPLGNIYPNGVDLSGGEWQRISIERALLRNHAELYIMDEPAAALDPIMESDLYKYFTNELQRKTIIITSHRLGACAGANYIYVFDSGEIKEQGSHEELMKLKGKYYKMYVAQRSLYEKD